jgi:hypothetical protein
MYVPGDEIASESSTSYLPLAMSNVHETNVHEAMSDNEATSGDTSMDDETYDAVPICPFTKIFNCKSPVGENGVICDLCYGRQRHALDQAAAKHFAAPYGTINLDERVLHELLLTLRRRDEEQVKQKRDADSTYRKYVCPTESYTCRLDTHITQVRTKVDKPCQLVDKEDTFCEVCAKPAIDMCIAKNVDEHAGELKFPKYLCILKDGKYADANLAFRKKMKPVVKCCTTRNTSQLCNECWEHYEMRAPSYLVDWFDKDTRMLNKWGQKAEFVRQQFSGRFDVVPKKVRETADPVAPQLSWHDKTTGF